MSNSNTNLQTQSSNALHNAIKEAGSKDCPPMLTPVAGAREKVGNVRIQNEVNTQNSSTKSQQDATRNIVNVAKARENVETETGKGCNLSQGEDAIVQVRGSWNPIQEVTPDTVDTSGPIFDAEPLQKVQNDDDNYNVFANEKQHLEQPESVNVTYDDDDLVNERDLLASLIEKLKCEIDDRKNHNKFLETSNKALVDKFKDLKKFQAELDRYHDVNYASKVAIDCAKAKGDLNVIQMESVKSCYNDSLALMLAPESDKTIHLAQESRSKLSNLIRSFDYEKLNNLYDLFVPHREKSPEQRYFSEREYYYADHMNAILGVYTTLDEFTDLQCDYVDQVVKCERLEKELSKSKTMSKSFEAL
ncbi:hypothetical protein Tco_0989308 [Tanacetum coccineum]|uniref:Uncharacterized protein n=1 Tax=Tanacetum coccineum TaxID=301880 RepID=A0ABQ5ETR7_9ASTR